MISRPACRIHMQIGSYFDLTDGYDNVLVKLSQIEETPFVEFTNHDTGKPITINLANISSVQKMGY